MSYQPSPAGFWKRYVAYFIDIIILYIAIEILSLLYFSFQPQSELSLLMDLFMSVQAGAAGGEMPDPYALMEKLKNILLPALIFSTVAFVLIAGTYFSVMESSKHQATVGKRMLGIKVTNAKGQPISLLQGIARFFAAGLSWITLNLGHAFAAWTPQRRALHDYVASTRVENVDPNNPKMPLWAWVVVIAHGLLFIGLTLFTVALMWLLMQELAAI